MVMAFILAPLIENSLRQSLLMSAGDFGIFVSRPISGTLMVVFALILIGQLVAAVKNRKYKCTVTEE
jgi:putative tricarboxylic transport membrane protein